MNATTRRPKSKPERFATLADGVLTLTIGKKVDTYDLRPIECQFGLGVQLAKHGSIEEPYHVCLPLADGHPSCECLGWLRHSHCKHIDALCALHACGKLPTLGEDMPEREQPWYFEDTAVVE